jgi:drug/metabolite transporter (DMT)-like permease
VITNPSGAMFGSAGAGAGLGVLAAFLSALMMITIRQLSRTEHTVTIVFYFALCGCLTFGAILPFIWVRPVGFEWVGLVGIGLVGGGSQFVMTHAYRYAPAAALAPFSYLTILWGTLFGYMFWDQLPGPRMLAGSAIVIVSGLYIFYRETRRHVRLRSLPVAADQTV